jgi:hypothetical protein
MNSPGPDSYSVRRFRPEDAAGVVACVRQVYGDAYSVHPELYQPEELARLNAGGELISVVALDAAGQVVGHYALERPGLVRVVESGEAMVLPTHQHHGLLERMRVLLEEEAVRLALVAIFGRCVTTHVFSQKAVERFGELPCGLSLGLSPARFHPTGMDSKQRVSTVMYLKYVQTPQPPRLHAPARYQDIIARIYRQFGLTATFEPAAAPPPGPGKVTVDMRPALQQAVLRVPRVETGTAAELVRLRRDLCAQNVEVIYLELPLAQAGTPAVADAAAEAGFFFSGIAPYFCADGDALRLQHIAVDLDPSEIQLVNPFARELLSFIEGERRASASRGRPLA